MKNSLIILGILAITAIYYIAQYGIPNPGSYEDLVKSETSKMYVDTLEKCYIFKTKASRKIYSSTYWYNLKNK